MQFNKFPSPTETFFYRQAVHKVRTARNVIESKRGIHEKYVFTYRDNRMVEICNTAWKRAWHRAALPMSRDVQKGPHNLGHTFGRRLRAERVPLETRKVLLGHMNGDITTHYSAAELAELIDAVERITSHSGKNPAATMLRRSLGVVTG